MNNLTTKKLILIIEDEKILAKTLKEKFEDEGFLVLNAFDGDEGLKIALKNHPDLILLDILIPKINGVEIIKKLQSFSWSKKIKIIILTNLNINKKSKTLSGGNYKYIMKTGISLEDTVFMVKKELEIEIN